MISDSAWMSKLSELPRSTCLITASESALSVAYFSASIKSPDWIAYRKSYSVLFIYVKFSDSLSSVGGRSSGLTLAFVERA